MNRMIIILLAAASLTASADVLSKKQRQFLENRRICVSRDTTTIEGKVISTYYRNGKPDWIMPAVVTNELKRITGREQNNPLQDLLVKANEDLAQAYTNLIVLAQRNAAMSNTLVIVEGRLNAAEGKINTEIDELNQEKADLDEKIADSKYILLRPWLKTKLASVEARIKILQALTANQE